MVVDPDIPSPDGSPEFSDQASSDPVPEPVRNDPESEQSIEVRRILSGFGDEQEDACEQLFELLYAEIKSIAAGQLKKEGPGHTLQNTALVHEAWMRLMDCDAKGWRDRAHFLNLTAQAMRHTLVDHARKRRAQKRVSGDAVRITLRDDLMLGGCEGLDLVEVEDTLQKLEGLDATHARIVELRVYGRMSCEEVGVVMDLKAHTVKRKWRQARAWMRAELTRSD